MGPGKCLLLAAVFIQVSAMPLSSQLSEEEEKVTRCIMEVLAESLSSHGPERIRSGCIRILKEDERLISMLRHQHLLKELEDLTQREKSQLDAERDSIEEEEEDLKKRASNPIPPPKRDSGSKRGSENDESKEFEKIEKVQVKEKEREHGTSAEEKVHELLEEEEKRNAPSKKAEEKMKRDGKEVRSDGATKTKDKKHYSEESEEDSSEERERERGYHGANNGWYHRNHEDWKERKRDSQRRMAEDPSQEETAQFESEDRGMKFFNAKTHMHGFHGEDKRHHHPEESEMDRERNYYDQGEDEMGRERHHYNGNHGHREEEERELEEMEEREEHRAKERDIHEVEEELRKAAERLEELHRG
ncbi:coiled-coil domain-containing glutamate-rich protein 2 isoform X1 [Engystomops pustulosus]|uniref:coiled-coil domain-containing glutamate-rich protein 2 isoform X1 n=1 Tax=Engystomops pustulosus TaxID=76066 RepID=UPI003AFAC254